MQRSKEINEGLHHSRLEKKKFPLQKDPPPELEMRLYTAFGVIADTQHSSVAVIFACRRHMGAKQTGVNRKSLPSLQFPDVFSKQLADGGEDLENCGSSREGGLL